MICVLPVQWPVISSTLQWPWSGGIWQGPINRCLWYDIDTDPNIIAPVYYWTYPCNCLSMWPYFSIIASWVAAELAAPGNNPFLESRAAWAWDQWIWDMRVNMILVTTWACWAIWAETPLDPPREWRNGLKPGGRSRGCCCWGGGKGMPPWKLLLMAPRKVGSGLGMFAKVVMGVILFGGRPGLEINTRLWLLLTIIQRSVILN